jgi:hypothetical protein
MASLSYAWQPFTDSPSRLLAFQGGARFPANAREARSRRMPARLPKSSAIMLLACRDRSLTGQWCGRYRVSRIVIDSAGSVMPCAKDAADAVPVTMLELAAFWLPAL